MDAAIINRNMSNVGGRGGVSIPGRQAPVIRVSEREMNRPENQQPLGMNEREIVQVEPQITLYINSPVCMHSAQLLHEIQNVHKMPCTVIDVYGLKNIPSWLRGTPSLVVENDVYCGDTAFAKVHELSMERSVSGVSLAKSPLEDIVSGKKRVEQKGCSLQDAFAPPPVISEEEANAKYSGDMNDILKRAMESR
jgi:hypothetical protein